MTPDLPFPSGGVKIIYRLVEHLQSHGHDARVWHGTLGFRFRGLPSNASIETALRVTCQPGDVLVMPEVGGSKWSSLNGATPVVMLVQGVDFIFANSSFLKDEPGRYPGWPHATAALATSTSVHQFLSETCASDFPIHHVPVEIDSYFVPAEKEKRIALMPRRRKQDLLAAIHIIRRSEIFRGWEISLIDGMTQREVAAELSRCPIFLFGGEREGFGLPGAEAMASGCWVIGFTGDGAKEYLRPPYGSPIGDSDVIRMAHLTLTAMCEFNDSPTEFSRKTSHAREFILSEYGPDRMSLGIARAMNAISAPGSPSVIEYSTTLSHYQVHAPSNHPYHRLRIAARSRARRSLEEWTFWSTQKDPRSR